MYLTELLYIEFLNVNVLSIKLENLSNFQFWRLEM